MSIINLYEKSDNLFFVGGIVRDELLNIDNYDIDLTYVGNAIDFAKNLNYEILQINEEFGSVHIKIDNKKIDITSTRTEKYPKSGHLPIVDKIGCSLKEDLVRRDFTINAIAKNCKSGKIFDFNNGIEDLKNKKLRILHEKSFIDDPTRIIRGLKFAIRFNFELETNTKNLQNEYLENVNYDMSYKRLKDELESTFNLNRQKALDEFISQKMYKLLSDKHFETPICNIEELINRYKSEIDNIWIIYLAGFDLSNLPLTKAESKILEDYRKLLNADLSTDFKVYKEFEKCNIESLLIYASLKDLDIVEKYLDKLRKINITITGKELKDMGYKPSEKFSKCLNAVLIAKLENPNLTYSEEIAIVKNFM